MAALGMLYAVASSVRNAVETHDLRARAISLRNQRIAYLREQHSSDAVVTNITVPGVNAAPAGQEERAGKAGPTSKKRR